MTSSRLLLIVIVAGLSALASTVPAVAPANATPGDSVDGPFHKAILKTAGEYVAWGRVDDEMRWAPTKCLSTAPGRVYVSASQNEETHGRKLYSVFARQREDYASLEESTDAVAVGQVVVKQSWVPQEVADPRQRPDRKFDFDHGKIRSTRALRPDRKRPDLDGGFDNFYPYAWKGDKVFKATKQADLFIMMKFDRETPDTDNGWVYATATPNGKRVTAAGRIESCMNCHHNAKRDRLFGLRQ